MSLADITSTYRAKLIVNSYKSHLKKGQKVLDVGCGNGVVSKQIEKYFRIKISGCDIMNYLTEKIPFTKMESATKLPFKNKEFDAVLLNDVLHHIQIEDQIKLIKESLRVAKMVLILEDKPTLSAKIFDIITNFIHNKNMEVPLTFRSLNGWEKLFQKNKIKFISSELPKPFLYPFNHISFALNSSK